MIISEEIRDILAGCYASMRVCSKVLFPDRFSRPFSPLHDEIFKVLDDDSIQKVVVKAPRGIGKTSIVNFAYLAKKILFREKKYIVPISNTSTQAVLQAENLKRELLSNEIIVKLFGSLKSDAFSKEQWVTESGTMVMPRGSGQQVRGLLYQNHRPDLIICDDLEDSESVRNEEQRKKLKQWFMADVINSIDRGRRDWKIVYIGTLLHEDSLLQNLLDDPSWTHVELDLCDDDYNSLWPEFIPTEEVKKMVEGYRTQGELDTFYREYRGQAIATEDATFMASYFKWYDETQERPFKKDHLENVIIVDPAKTTKMHSAWSAIAGIGVDLIGGGIYIRDLIGAMLHPDKLYDEIFDMAERLKVRVIAVEVTSLNEFITYPLKNEMMRRGKLYEIIELNPRGTVKEEGKKDRIKALVPLYRQGLIWHNKNVTGPLEAQLLSFPNSKRLDCADAVAYIIELMEQGDRYFFPKSESANPVEEKKMAEVMIDDYMEEDNLDIAGDSVVNSGSWRLV